MAARPLPSPTVPLVDAGGFITPAWFDYFKTREMLGMSDLPDVKLTALANGQVLIWNAADKKYENGAN